MSQEQNEQSRRARRIARAQRSRPVLVTSKSGDEAPAAREATPLVSEPEVATTTEVATPKATATSKRPGFFSTIGKRAVDKEKQESEIAQARLARAARTKTGKTAVVGEQVQEPAKVEEKKTSRPAPQRPQSAFKTRYLIGMAAYLLCANFLGAYEVQYMRVAGLDRVLTSFDLFGGKMVISTSTLVFLATLVLILVILAKLDLIPRSLMSTQPAAKKNTAQTAANTDPAPKYTPPPVRQGVKGADDELYQAYRAGQRRDKRK